MNCRSCGAEVVWLVMEPSGTRMPVDARPSFDGTIAADLQAGTGRVVPLEHRANTADRPAGRLTETPLYRSHFATCPHAARWRRRR